MAQTTAAYAASSTSNNSNVSLSMDHEPSVREAAAVAVAYEPNSEERAVLRDCASSSFWYAALPASVIAGTAMGMLAKTGTYFKANGRLGALPHIATGMFMGYIGGKLSYVTTCEEMLITRAPNSPMAQAIHARREGRSGSEIISPLATHAEIMGVGPATRGSIGGMRGGSDQSGGSFDGNLFGWSGSSAAKAKSKTTSQYQSPSNEEYQSNIDVDSEQSSARNEVEDYHASNYDFDAKPGGNTQRQQAAGGGANMPAAARPQHSYDELRRYNRDTYYHPNQQQQQQQQQQAQQTPQPAGYSNTRFETGKDGPSLTNMQNEAERPPMRGSGSQQQQQQPTGGGYKRVNQYGDPILE